MVYESSALYHLETLADKVSLTYKNRSVGEDLEIFIVNNAPGY